MKGLLKLILRILWPFLSIFLIWLFFLSDESDTIISLFAGLCGVGLLIGLLPIIYNENKLFVLLGKIGLGVAVGSFFVPFICGALVMIMHVANSSFIIVLISIIALICSFISYVILLYTLKHNANVTYFPAMRIMMMTFALCSSLCFFVISMLAYFDIVINDYETIYFLGKWKYNLALATIAGEVVIGIPSITIAWLLIKDCHFLVYERTNYTIFLRSFQFDNNKDANKLIELLKNSGMNPILKIGNPSTFFLKGLGDVFYLPSKKWQYSLNYYIERAKYICVVVDVTEGVLWEMFHHLNTSYKTLYIVSDINKLHSLINSKKYKEYNKTFLGMSLFKVSHQTKYKEFAFYVSNCKCYYGPIDIMALFLINQECSNRIDSFTFAPSQGGDNGNSSFVSSPSKSSFIYNIFDVMRLLSRFSRNMFRGGVLSFAHIGILLIFLGMLIMGVSGFVFGIMSIIELYNNGFSTGIVLKICLGFGMCMYMIKGLVTFFKD